MKNPSNYTSYPMGSVSQNSETETIARNIMVILSKSGDTFRELSFDEYQKARIEDGATISDTLGEKPYFEKCVGYCVSSDKADSFENGWYTA